MTADELEALAERVEAGETGRNIDALIFLAITPGAMLARDRTPNAADPDVQCWVPGTTERGKFVMPPAYRTSLDAAVSAISDGTEWEMTTLYGFVRVTVGLNNGDGETFDGSNKCGLIAPAIVAAGLRERAYTLRQGEHA